VDVTIYRDGFAKNLFVSLPSVVRAGIPVRTPELDKVASNARRPFEIVSRNPAYDEKTGQASIEIARLEPGLIYRFRLALPTPGGATFSKELAIEVPVCVADYVNGKKP
jgi:hypothetical protein